MFFIARHSKKFKKNQVNLGHIKTYDILLHLSWLRRLTCPPLAGIIYPGYYEKVEGCKFNCATKKKEFNTTFEFSSFRIQLARSACNVVLLIT